MNDVSILVVDDDDDVREALLDELSPHYVVTSASCGEEAFALLSANRFDVVISDLRMPDHDGIEVLDFAQVQQHGIVRILLTGYLDDRAHAALMVPGAPYKVGKPWHDEIEVVLRRALEQRERTRALTASLEAAFSLNDVEAALRAAGTLEELGELLVLRAATIVGVTECAAILDGRVVAGQLPPVGASGWRVTLPIDIGARLCLVARGDEVDAHELLSHLARRAQRQGGVLTGQAATHAARPRRSRVEELMRQAMLGAMAGAVIHDIAGILQGIDGALLTLTGLAAERNDLELLAVTEDVAAAGNEAVELFVAMRRLMREGKPAVRDVCVSDLVRRAVVQAGAVVRARAALRVAELPDISVFAAEPLVVQVLTAVLRNAAAASPDGRTGAVDVEVRADGDRVLFVITDDGPGVAADIAEGMFEPHLWQRPEGVGAGLAIAAYALRLQGGAISYRRAPGRGASFIVSLPRVATPVT